VKGITDYKLALQKLNLVTERLLINRYCVLGATNQSIPNNDLLKSIQILLTPNVVKSLPEYFQNVVTDTAAQTWLDTINQEGELLLIRSKTEHALIGCIFMHEATANTVHIGYLIAESHWGKGLARESLSKLIDMFLMRSTNLTLMAGVERNNIASTKVLTALGFNLTTNNQSQTLFYLLPLKKS
jgi:RimJ/RimL family protein N-acetyltransferase